MFDKLRKLKPEIKSVDALGTPDPRFHGITLQVPTKEVRNTRNDMDLLRLYSHGPLKYENTGRTCGNCVNFYYDPSARYGGRCKARGFMQTHEDTPADRTYGFTHPVDGMWFSEWPECPLFTLKERLSRK